MIRKERLIGARPFGLDFGFGTGVAAESVGAGVLPPNWLIGVAGGC